ncbi:MAG TPA: ZIP family metal transporter [Candidatus Polarisedimenticolaceae bacterium]
MNGLETGLAAQVFWAALATAIATGLGAIPFAFVPKPSPRWQSLMLSAAGGMMISASVFSLANEALDRGEVWEVALGILAGAGFFAGTARWLHGGGWTIEGMTAHESRQSVLILLAMFIHSIPEGVAIGVGYATGEIRFGFLLALAIAVHNVPEGIAVTIPLRARGVSLWRCAGYAVLTSAPQPIFAVPAFLLVRWFEPLLPAGLGFAGGAMIYLVAQEMMPESYEGASRGAVAWAFVLGLLAMLMLTTGLGIGK